MKADMEDEGRQGASEGAITQGLEGCCRDFSYFSCDVGRCWRVSSRGMHDLTGVLAGSFYPSGCHWGKDGRVEQGRATAGSPRGGWCR